jgi:hypothetical protein
MFLATQGIEEKDFLKKSSIKTFFFGKHFSYYCGHSSHVAARAAIFPNFNWWLVERFFEAI